MVHNLLFVCLIFFRKQGWFYDLSRKQSRCLRESGGNIDECVPEDDGAKPPIDRINDCPQIMFQLASPQELLGLVGWSWRFCW